MRIPDYLVVGHLARDRDESGDVLGGTAAYAGRAARQLGKSVAVVTSAPVNPSSVTELAGLEFATIPSDEWTAFSNEYGPTGRRQHWFSTAEAIDIADVPHEWNFAPIVHLAPIAQEITPDFAMGYPTDLCCATIQGWLRRRSSTGSVLVEVNPQLERALRYLDVAIVSENDVMRDSKLILEFASASRILIVTRAEKGCDVFVNGEMRRVATTALKVDNPTGAGDVFAAAFFSYFAALPKPVDAAKFANDFTGWFLDDPSKLDDEPGTSGMGLPGSN